MNITEWVLVVLLSVTLLIFLIVAIVLGIKLIFLTEEAKKIIQTGQGIATKADDIIDNVKGMTSVGGIVKTFANHIIEGQERRYAAEDAARAARAESVARATNPESAANAETAARAANKKDTANSAKRAETAQKLASAAKVTGSKVKSAVDKVKRAAKAAKQ